MDYAFEYWVKSINTFGLDYSEWHHLWCIKAALSADPGIGKLGAAVVVQGAAAELGIAGRLGAG